MCHIEVFESFLRWEDSYRLPHEERHEELMERIQQVVEENIGGVDHFINFDFGIRALILREYVNEPWVDFWK